jgi:hypothetical protein
MCNSSKSSDPRAEIKLHRSDAILELSGLATRLEPFIDPFHVMIYRTAIERP